MALTSMALRQVRADKRVAILDGDNAIDYRLNCERGACALRFEFLAQKIFFALRFELAQKIFFAVNIRYVHVHNRIRTYAYVVGTNVPFLRKSTPRTCRWIAGSWQRERSWMRDVDEVK